MKLLKDILYKSRISEVVGSTNVAIESVCFDSRQANAFAVFVAIKGTQVDGHNFIATAIENGTKAVVCEQLPDELVDGVNYVRVKNSAQALAYMSANFYDNPSEKIDVIGVTGTNGKTSIVTMLFNLFTDLGYKCGMLSTVVNRIGKVEIESTHTTSDAVKVNALLSQMVDEGCQFCFMEVSSHALDQHRVDGIKFKVAGYTNITHDHLDYHGNFNNYIAAKKLLFDGLTPDAIAVVNKDDRHWQDMVRNTQGKVYGYALKSIAEYKGKILDNQFSGLQLHVNGKDLYSQLIGEFNASNLLAIYGIAMACEQDELEVLTGLSKIKPAPGRFQVVPSSNGLNAIVDYAHTPDALKNVLDTIGKIRTGNEQVITVVGCGGDRDTAKRPKMAVIAAKGSNRVVITSDNPRTEEPQVIINDMVAGLDPNQKKITLSIESREEAIKTAVALSQPGDILLIAGKGHEKYQEINGVCHHFDDVEIVKELIN